MVSMLSSWLYNLMQAFRGVDMCHMAYMGARGTWQSICYTCAKWKCSLAVYSTVSWVLRQMRMLGPALRGEGVGLHGQYNKAFRLYADTCQRQNSKYNFFFDGQLYNFFSQNIVKFKRKLDDGGGLSQPSTILPLPRFHNNQFNPFWALIWNFYLPMIIVGSIQ